MSAPAPPVAPARQLGRRVALLLAGAGWLALLLHATRVYAPSGTHLESYNSDVAVLTVMANGRSLSPYWLFYLGQDRYGAWPFLLLNALGRILGHTWSPLEVTAYATLFIFLAAIPFSSLAPRTGIICSAAYLAVLLAHPGTTWLYEHVYGWQIGALLWTWAFYRAAARRPLAQARWHVAGAFAGSVLACWSSPASGPILLVWAALEWLWARRDPDAPGRGARTLLALAGAAATGIAAEIALRKLHNAYARAIPGEHNFNFTGMRMDWGHLAENFAAVLRAFGGQGLWWVWALLGLVGAISAVEALARRRGTETPLERDLGLLTVQAMAAALLTFAVVGAVIHVRDSEYHPRYLAPVCLFSTCAGMVALFRVVALRIAPQWHPAAALGLGLLYLLVALNLMPAPAADPRYRELREAARFAASPASPSPVVYGDYWDTLVFAGFQQELAPVATEGQMQRLPWTVERLRAAPAVLLSRAGSGESLQPDPWLIAHGAPLQRRSAEPVYQGGSVTLHAYDNRSAGARPLEVPGCAREPAEVRFPPARRGWLLAQATRPGARLHLDVGEPGAATPAQVQTQAQEMPGARLLAVRFESAEPLTSARLRVEPPGDADGPAGQPPEGAAGERCARAWLVADREP